MFTFIGITNVGRNETENEHDIQLRGNLVADDHWYLLFTHIFFSLLCYCIIFWQ